MTWSFAPPILTVRLNWAVAMDTTYVVPVNLFNLTVDTIEQTPTSTLWVTPYQLDVNLIFPPGPPTAVLLECYDADPLFKESGGPRTVDPWWGGVSPA